MDSSHNFDVMQFNFDFNITDLSLNLDSYLAFGSKRLDTYPRHLKKKTIAQIFM